VETYAQPGRDVVTRANASSDDHDASPPDPDAEAAADVEDSVTYLLAFNERHTRRLRRHTRKPSDASPAHLIDHAVGGFYGERVRSVEALARPCRQQAVDC
jgi:hypothetical protein